MDTHTHVNFNAFKEDGDEVVRRSLDSETWLINVGSQSSTSARAVKMAEKYEKGVYAAVGLHPIHLFESYQDVEELSFKTRAEEFDYNFYKNLAKNVKRLGLPGRPSLDTKSKVVAIGEIGLDYYHLPKDRVEELKKKQAEVLTKQIELAQELNLPVIFHCREAYEDLLEIIKKLSKIPRGVLHCFAPLEISSLTGFADTYEIAQKFLDLGFMLSFTGIITYPKADRIREVIKKIPLEKIMIETDAPYLSPQPVRGTRNEPIYVKYVAEEIAKLRGLSFDEVAKATTENAIKFFNL